MGENWSITPELLAEIKNLIPAGSTILELGSGEGTQRLIDEGYRVVSIEHDDRFVKTHPGTCIHAPIEPFKKQCGVFEHDTGWYNRAILRDRLPGLEYDLILIDGPPGRIGRGGFYKWFELFDHTVPMVFDDVHRGREMTLVQRVSAKLRTPFVVHGCWTPCHFAVLDPRKEKHG